MCRRESGVAALGGVVGPGAAAASLDGALWSLPFQALVTPGGRYVIEDQAIFYAPSLTTL